LHTVRLLHSTYDIIVDMLYNYQPLPVTDNEIGIMYLSGLSANKISTILECNPHKIGHILNKLHIPKRNPSETKRTYQLKEDFFDTIGTEEKAYFLGFLFADGNNHISKSVVSLRLQEKDKAILEQLSSLIYLDKKELGYIKPRTLCNGKYTSASIYRLNICNKHISHQLNNLGCVANKTFTLKFPDESQVPKHLVHHFIRGYFDGDGSITVINTPHSVKGQFTLAGNENFLLKIQNILIENCNLSKTKLRNPGNISVLVYSGRYQLQRIRDYLYKDATIYLDRKFLKFSLF
jgi:hypothetical protein